MIVIDRATCANLATAESREWIVANGLGGFASGTIAGTLTRRYHGLLFAARRPPVSRTLLCPKIDAALGYDGRSYALATDRWGSGTVAPEGYVYVNGFVLDGTVPVWTYACGDAIIERRVWMEHNANRTYVCYRIVQARSEVAIRLRAFANHRDLHATTKAGDWHMDVRATPEGVRVVPYDGAATIFFRADRGAFAAEHVWYRDFMYTAERDRGLDDREDHLLAASLDATLLPGESLTVAVADHDLAPVESDAAALRERERERLLLGAATGGDAQTATLPPWARQLVLGADQFVVRRPLPSDPYALSIVAGYHWFGDWGRDTAIALPGIALATGRPGVARSILLTFASYIDRGMLPNFFPDSGEPAEYNTVDAALWYVEAVRRYIEATGDGATLPRLYDAVAAIVDGYTAGTRYGIGVDPADGLLQAGEPGVALTWMDAKVGDWVVTPRIGKAVEVNALWVNALRACAALAGKLGLDGTRFATAAQRAEGSFERFWNERGGCCYDVIDGPSGDDASLRPNQLFAVALPIEVLDAARRRAILEVCASRLWTPVGLRSLDPADARFVGRYGGTPAQRDAAYHQGTVWTWLAGPFALAHLRVYADPAVAAALLAECAGTLTDAALGMLGEIADGNAPFSSRGAIAQAWSVATVLDAWCTIGAGERS